VCTSWTNKGLGTIKMHGATTNIKRKVVKRMTEWPETSHYLRISNVPPRTV